MTTRILLIPGGTAIGAVALAHAGLHKMLEVAQERDSGSSLQPDTVVVLRAPDRVPPTTLRTAAVSVDDVFPDIPQSVRHAPEFLDGVDLVVETSGSTTGQPRQVGISVRAVQASIQATHEALGGPGVWILALPAHHIAGAMVLLRSTFHDFPPRIVDTSGGFDPQALIPAIRGALSLGVRAYLSVVPAQLRKILADDEACQAVASLSAVLVGGQSVSRELVERARQAGIRVHTTYGMSETCGGVVYDGRPLSGVDIRIVDQDAVPFPCGVQGRIAIASPTLMTRYLEGGEPWVDIDGQRFLLTNDWGVLDEGGRLEVLGRVDDVVISGGVKLLPAVGEAAIGSFEGVAQVWVGALADERWGSVLAAVVVPDVVVADRDEWCVSLYEYVKGQLGSAYAPRVVCVVDELPVGGSAKVDRRQCISLVELAIEAGQAWCR